MTVRAPYNFVPLSPLVCFAGELSPALAGLPSQDMPVENSQSGRLALTFTAETPILVGWNESGTDTKTFGTTPEGTPAIPGSSWRGMVRNVLEIAAFGRMALVDDQRTTMRDLTARTDYTRHFTKTLASDAFQATPEAGWLQIVNGSVTLTPCEYARVDHRDTLSALSVGKGRGFRERIDEAIKIHGKRVRGAAPVEWARPGQTPRPTDTTIAEIVQRIFLEGQDADLNTKLWVDDLSADYPHSADPRTGKRKLLHYRKASKDQASLRGASSSRQSGTLVFTGMPSDRKHMEFFFFNPSVPEPVDETVLRLFRSVCEQQEKVSPTWKWRDLDFSAGRPIPVFFIREGQKVRQIGLSMMFKMAGDNSVGDLIKNTGKGIHRAPETDDSIDLPTRLFGRIGPDRSRGGDAQSFRGRLSFGWAVARNGTWRNGAAVRVHLQKPKPGFYPAYVRQRDHSGVDGTRLAGKVAYRTYMDWTGKPKEHEEIRGWKRYPVLTDRNPERTAPDAPALVPLVPGPNGKPIFDATLRYHNLHPVELGAVIWAVTWGGDDQLRHSIGMGKPLGWGQLKVSATLSEEQKAALDAFVQAMEAWARRNGLATGWKGSVQINQLSAMANPAVGNRNRDQLKQMVLDTEGRDNPFIEAKKAREVLPEYDLDDIADISTGPDGASTKGLADLSVYDQQATRTAIAEARDSFAHARMKREEAAAEAVKHLTARKKADDAARFANDFPVGSRVTVGDDPTVRMVVEVISNKRRMVSKREDGTGAKKEANVSTLKPAP